jgi:hypothetical protein
MTNWSGDFYSGTQDRIGFKEEDGKSTAPTFTL